MNLINNSKFVKNIKNETSNFNFEYYTYKNGKTINVKTGLEIKHENENDLKNMTHEDIEKLFFDMAYVIDLNRKKYSKKYDELNGEGAYERYYKLENIYDSTQYCEEDYEDYDIHNEEDYEDYKEDYEHNDLNFNK